MQDRQKSAVEEVPDTAFDRDALWEQLLQLRDHVSTNGDRILDRLTAGRRTPDRHRGSLANLAHYIALRNRDLRPLQRHLMYLGLSSVGRLEGRVLPTLDAVLSSLAAIRGVSSPFSRPDESTFFHGEAALRETGNELLGPARDHRRSRIMVTLPAEAAEQPDYISDLVLRGMDIARINCAHDDPEVWEKLARHVRAAGEAMQRETKVLMDIAGPKIRIENVQAQERKAVAGDRLRLMARNGSSEDADAPFSATVSLPEIIERIEPGHRVRYNDGKLEGVVKSVREGEAIIEVTHTKTGGCKLKPEKGLNFPDTDLGISPLTSKDQLDLEIVARHADMIGYSFISRPDDIDLLEEALSRSPSPSRPLGFVAKIEQPAALKNLPALIARARLFDRPFGVMIARGDLAAEIGFERVAEMQEELLWICEAAAVPTIWATQVLEDLVKTGIPSRGEMTDAAMSARAECVMLNKGPAVDEAVSLLDRLLGRMDGHVMKKTATLRPLKTWSLSD
jgi:pyruvate kinase